MRWYAVTRRYRVTDVIYVKAQNGTQAKQLCEEGEYEYLSEAEPIRGTPYSLKAERRDGVPMWVWEEMPYEEREEAVIAS